MEKFFRKLAVNICGAFYAAWLLARNFFGRIFYGLQAGRIQRQTLRSIEKANALAKATGYTYYVLKTKGRIVVRPKRLIKNMLACKGKYFKRGTTIQDIERIALYIAKNQGKNVSDGR